MKKKISLVALAVALPLGLTLGGVTPAYAASVVRTGVFGEYGDCETYRRVALNENKGYLTTSGCYNLGPGAAGWYYDAYWNV